MAYIESKENFFSPNVKKHVKRSIEADLEKPVINIKANHINSLAYFDSGSSISIISYSHFSKLSEMDLF